MDIDPDADPDDDPDADPDDMDIDLNFFDPVPGDDMDIDLNFVDPDPDADPDADPLAKDSHMDIDLYPAGREPGDDPDADLLTEKQRVKVLKKAKMIVQQKNAVVKFIKINQMLQEPWVVVPQSSAGSSFVTFTETSVLRHMPSWDQTWLKASRKSMDRPTGSLLKEIYGPTLGGRFDFITVDQLIERVENPFADDFAKRVDSYLDDLDQKGELKRKDCYLIHTSFLSDGFQVYVLVTNLRKKKSGSGAKVGPASDLAEKPTRRKKPENPDFLQSEKEKIKTVIGVDFGETFSAGFCAKSVKDYSVVDEGGGEKRLDYGGKVVNLAIKTSALNEPTRKFQNWLRFDKKKVPSPIIVVSLTTHL